MRITKVGTSFGVSPKKVFIQIHPGKDLLPLNLTQGKPSLSDYRESLLLHPITIYEPENLDKVKKLPEIDCVDFQHSTERLAQKLVDMSDDAFNEIIIKRSKNTAKNFVISSDSEVCELLNCMIKILPEMGSMVERKQNEGHAFDVLKHSLKVLQKLNQSPEFEHLSSSDKKVINYCALFHDITKEEGISDPLHPLTGCQQAIILGKKLGLTETEYNKLYKMVKYHKLLGDYDRNNVEKSLKTLAYDLREDNLYEMARMFRMADLKGRRADDSEYIRKGKPFMRFEDAKIRAYRDKINAEK